MLAKDGPITSRVINRHIWPVPTNDENGFRKINGDSFMLTIIIEIFARLL